MYLTVYKVTSNTTPHETMQRCGPNHTSKCAKGLKSIAAVLVSIQAKQWLYNIPRTYPNTYKSPFKVGCTIQVNGSVMPYERGCIGLQYGGTMMYIE